MEIDYIIILFLFFHLVFSANNTAYNEKWRDFPACRLGRLQSPIEINEYESIYSNDFSFVYQNYKGDLNAKLERNENNYAFVADIQDGGYLNFERGGVIKQYELKRIELYPGLHKINGDLPNYELHLVHEKNLDFKTNKNQYRRIQDPNMFLTIVLRYYNKDKCPKENNGCSSDDNLLNDLKNGNFKSLNDYPVFQDKRAFLYEGSSMHIPCDENVNYYVIKDIFYCEDNLFNNLPLDSINLMNKYGRPVYKNFMNYREVLKSKFISIKIITFLLIIFILF